MGQQKGCNYRLSRVGQERGGSYRVAREGQWRDCTYQLAHVTCELARHSEIRSSS